MQCSSRAHFQCRVLFFSSSKWTGHSVACCESPTPRFGARLAISSDSLRPAECTECAFAHESSSRNPPALEYEFAISRLFASMVPARVSVWLGMTLLVLLGGCAATRPINPPISKVDGNSGYRYLTRQPRSADQNNLVILAFSGGGTRAAAFSYGVLEALRGIEIVGPKGNRIRLLDEVDLITGVSGGSFTALAYGLYGDKLFDRYENQFLKRNVQGELISRFLSPRNWGALWSGTWGRSEMAAELYDEILFNGATFADLDRGSGPLIVVTATDISTGARVGFIQPTFDVMCSDQIGRAHV